MGQIQYPAGPVNKYVAETYQAIQGRQNDHVDKTLQLIHLFLVRVRKRHLSAQGGVFTFLKSSK